MSWILMLLKNLPAIMAAIQTLISIFAAKSAMANHAAFQASVAAGNLASSADWNLYVAGQGGGAAALGVGAVACLIGQGRQWRAHSALERQEAAEAVALSQIVSEREQAAKAYALRAEMSGLSPACQAIVRGQ